MSVSMTGREYPVMTAVALYQVMIATTVNHVTEIIVRSAAHIARCVIPRCVWGVLMNVPHATSLFARAVLPNARIAKKLTVRIV